jgi:hypothetical protein
MENQLGKVDAAGASFFPVETGGIEQARRNDHVVEEIPLVFVNHCTLAFSFDRRGGIEQRVWRQVVVALGRSQVVLDRRVVGLVVEVTDHDDVGFGIGSDEGIDALAEDIGGLVAERLVVEFH